MPNLFARYADQIISIWIAATLVASILAPGSLAHRLLAITAIVWLGAIGVWVIVTTANGKAQR